MDVLKKQSTQKISNQKMKLKERDKSILEYVQCMYNNVHAYIIYEVILDTLYHSEVILDTL